MKRTKLVCLMLAMLMIATLFVGCNSNTATTTPSSSPANSTAPADNSSEPTTDPSDPHDMLEDVAAYSSADIVGEEFALPGNVPPLKLPLTDTVQKVSIWELTPEASTNMVDFGDSETWKEAEKRLGIDFEFISASTASPRESFTLAVASQDYPDIMTHTAYYVGGIDKAVNDGVFVDLTDFQDWIPHYMAIVNANEQNNRDARTDSGKMGQFCSMMYNSLVPMNINGMVYRRDMLEKSGYSKPLPETWDEWTDMLTYLKDDFDLPEALVIDSTGVSTFNSPMLTGLGIVHTYIMRDGKVEYARITDEYKTYLTYMSDWYSKKLLRQDFYTYQTFGHYTQMTELCAKDELFVLNGWTAFAGDFFKRTGVATNPDFYISAIKDPVINKGDKPMSRSFSDSNFNLSNPNGGFAVTTNAEDPTLCMKIMDYFYSSEGALLAAYGPWEGTNADDLKATYYRAEDGRPMVTKILSANPDGLNMGFAFQKYAMHTSFPYMIWNRESDIYDDGMKETIAVWNDVSREGDTSVLPAAYSLTADEGAEVSAAMGDIGTYVDEMTIKFILGQEPIANYDAYVSQIKAMNIDRVCELQQQAVDRYLSRGK